MMDEPTIRQATLADKEAVLSIHDHVYDGRDYLPVCYDEIVSSTNVTAFVMFHRDSAIGFKAAFLVDDGETLVSRAGRISPKYEGQGLYRKLDEHVLAWARRNHIKRKALTAVNGNENVTKQSFQEINKLILQKAMLTYLIDQTKIHLKNSDLQSVTTITEVSEDLLKSYIQSEEAKKYLFPHNRIIVNWIPYRLMTSNVPLMALSSSTTYIYTDVNISSCTYSGLLSVGTLYPVKEPSFLYNLDIYGRNSQSLRSHLVKHLVILKEKTIGVTNVLLFADGGIPPEHIIEEFKELGFILYQWQGQKNAKQIWNVQLLFERELS